jgi:hypothetical protein
MPMPPCCDKHDRMDKVLDTRAFNDALCGTPTNPDGEQRYCCRKCEEHGRPLRLQANWAANPRVVMHLSKEESAQCFALADGAGLPLGEMLAGAK